MSDKRTIWKFEIDPTRSDCSFVGTVLLNDVGLVFHIFERIK